MVKPVTGSAVTVFDQSTINAIANSKGSIPPADAGPEWFGPLDPPRPQAPATVAGRQFDYPAGVNLVTRPRSNEGITFSQLRGLADGWDILRTVIETRKDQMAKMKWSIKAKTRGKAKIGKPVAGAQDDPRIAPLEAFFLSPDREHSWADWLRMLLEDMFVLDAPAIYRQRSYGGGLYSLQLIDGATIKRVLDPTGRTPVRPLPAYQQILKGMPAVNYSTAELIYRPRNPRTHKVYGYSPVEQIVSTINVALLRQLHTTQYYTEGNIPEALIGVPDDWTPDQIKQFQEWWDSILEGQTASRRHAHFVPAGVGKTYIETKDVELKGLFDDWLARVVCFAFSISPQPFVAQMNRATAQTAKEASIEEGLAPVMEWVKGLIDLVLLQDFGITDLEFEFEEEDETDPKVQMEILTGYQKAGALAANEVRDRIGYEDSSEPGADQQMVLTTAGYVPLNSYVLGQEAAAANAQLALETAKLAPAPAIAAGTGKGAPAPADAKADDAGEVGKAAGLPFAKSTLGPVPYPRRLTEKATVALKTVFDAAFTRQATDTASAIRDTEFDADAIEAMVAKLDLGLTLEEIAKLVEHYSAVASSSGEIAVTAIVPGDKADVFEQVNEAAQKWAEEHAAELVTAVDDTTRDLVRNAIAAGTAEGLSAAEIADSIEALGAFSSDRSVLIAQTEIAFANSYGALDGYRAAKESGTSLKKVWLLGPDACDVCQENADAGPIDLDDTFPSGDDAPPGHPRCTCALSPVVESDDPQADE